MHNNFIFETPIVKGMELPLKIVSNLQENDIVLCKLENVNDVILIDKDKKDYIFSNEFIVIRSTNINYQYLYFYFLSETFKKNKEKLLTGVKKRYLKISTIKSLDIPIFEVNANFERINNDWKNYYNNLIIVFDLFKRNKNKLNNIYMYYLTGKHIKNIENIKHNFFNFEIPSHWKTKRIKEITNKIVEGQKKEFKMYKQRSSNIICK